MTTEKRYVSQSETARILSRETGQRVTRGDIYRFLERGAPPLVTLPEPGERPTYQQRDRLAFEIVELQHALETTRRRLGIPASKPLKRRDLTPKQSDMAVYLASFYDDVDITGLYKTLVGVPKSA